MLLVFFPTLELVDLASRFSYLTTRGNAVKDHDRRGHADVGVRIPYGPIWARFCLKKSLILIKNHKIANKNIKGVKSLKKIYTWFCDKDLDNHKFA